MEFTLNQSETINKIHKPYIHRHKFISVWSNYKANVKQL